MKKFYTPPTFITATLNASNKRNTHSFLGIKVLERIKRTYAFFLLASLLFFGGNVWGQTTYSWTSGTTWLGGTWSYTTYSGANTYPGNKATTTNNDIAYFNNNTNTAATNNYINMNTQSGTHYLGAVYFGSSATTARVISNSSSTASGIMYLNGVTLNSVANTVIWNESLATHSFTVANTFGIELNNTTNNIIQITGTGGITISSIISGSGKNLTKAGSGSGVLTLGSAANTYSGITTITAGELRLNPSSTSATFASQINLLRS